MYMLDVRLPSLASEFTFAELSFHFESICSQQKSWTEEQKATFSSIYETGLCVSIRRRQQL